jgi:hypothetical protein
MTVPFNLGGKIWIAIQNVWIEVSSKVERCRRRRVKGAKARHNFAASLTLTCSAGSSAKKAAH